MKCFFFLAPFCGVKDYKTRRALGAVPDVQPDSLEFRTQVGFQLRQIIFPGISVFHDRSVPGGEEGEEKANPSRISVGTFIVARME